jgi:predicted Zn-dependent protease
VVAAFFLFEAAEHGGEVVYNYAGGVGTRSGHPEHVKNLLVAGLYQAARADREAGDTASAARLTEELARQRPDDFTVQVLAARSLLVDRHDPAAALAALAAIQPPDGNARAALQVGVLRSDAWIGLGEPDSARAVLAQLTQQYPDNEMVQRVVGEATEKLR